MADLLTRLRNVVTDEIKERTAPFKSFKPEVSRSESAAIELEYRRMEAARFAALPSGVSLESDSAAHYVTEKAQTVADKLIASIQAEFGNRIEMQMEVWRDQLCWHGKSIEDIRPEIQAHEAAFRQAYGAVSHAASRNEVSCPAAVDPFHNMEHKIQNAADYVRLSGMSMTALHTGFHPDQQRFVEVHRTLQGTPSTSDIRESIQYLQELLKAPSAPVHYQVEMSDLSSLAQQNVAKASALLGQNASLAPPVSRQYQAPVRVDSLSFSSLDQGYKR